MAENYNDMPSDVRAFMLDADRTMRMHTREANQKTPEQIERKRIFEEKNEDIEKILFNEMTVEEYEQKWGVS